jgi:hypothetical protein
MAEDLKHYSRYWTSVLSTRKIMFISFFKPICTNKGTHIRTLEPTARRKQNTHGNLLPMSSVEIAKGRGGYLREV